MPYDHESINETDYDNLRMALSLHEEGSILPDKVVDAYWQIKRIHNRIGTGSRMDASVIALMCWQLGYGKPNQSETAAPTVVSLYQSGELKDDDPVVVKYRNKERLAVIKGITGDGSIRVQIDGDDKERVVAAENVSVEMAVA